MKSFKPKGSDKNNPSDTGSGKNPTVNFRGQKRKNDTHQSVTDPEARLYKKAKGQQAKLCYLGHALMENRSGLVVDTRVSLAIGTDYILQHGATGSNAFNILENVSKKSTVSLKLRPPSAPGIRAFW